MFIINILIRLQIFKYRTWVLLLIYVAFLCATGVLYLHLYYWRRVYREGGAKGQNLYFFANNIIHEPLDVPRSYIYIYVCVTALVSSIRK